MSSPRVTKSCVLKEPNAFFTPFVFLIVLSGVYLEFLDIKEKPLNPGCVLTPPARLRLFLSAAGQPAPLPT